MRTSVLLTLCCALCAVLANDACPYEWAPTDLASLSYLGFKGETHFQGVYSANFSKGMHEIAFTLTSSTVARFHVSSVTPEPTTVDLTIRSSTGAVLYTADTILASDRQVAATLAAGSYKLRLTFVDFEGTADTCSTFSLEGALIPRARVLARAAQFTCPSSDVLPVVNFTGLLSGKAVSYSSGNATFSAVVSTGLRWFGPLYFTVPSVGSGSTVRSYELTTRLWFNFPTGGYLGMALVLGTSVWDAAPVSLVACVASGNCTLGTHPHKNAQMIRATVGVGTHALWFVQPAGLADPSIGSCQPFGLDITMTPVTATEDLLTCPSGSPYPTAFTLGSAQSSNYTPFYYRRDVLLDISNTQHTISLVVKSTILLRVFTSAHRVDIDLKLMSSSGSTLAYAYKAAKIPEAIQIRLTPGTYTLQVLYFGTNVNVIFCETFAFELQAISVPSAGWSHCTGAATSRPSLAALRSGPVNSTGEYVEVLQDSTQRTITSTTFRVSSESRFVARIGANAVLGDVTMTLRAVGAGTSVVTYATHLRNLHEITQTLTPGFNYTFAVMTGATQATTAGSVIQGFPSCSKYSLSYYLRPVSTLTAAEKTCNKRLLPQTLDGGEFFRSAKGVHLAGDFNTPANPGSWNSWGSSMTIKPPMRSVLRAFVPAHHLDIDLFLFRNTTRVAQGVLWGTDETVSYVLEANVEYQLETRFFHWTSQGYHSNDPVCWTYYAQIAVEPLPVFQADSCTTTSSLPAPLFPSVMPSSGRSLIEGSYYVPRVGAAAEVSVAVNFTVTKLVLFRAILSSTFLTTNLGIKIASVDGVTLASTKGTYDYSECYIDALVLSPGTYTITIYEAATPDVVVSDVLTSCVRFYLLAGIELVSQADLEPSTCSAVSLSRTLNGPGAIHMLSGQRVHVYRNILADVTSRRDDTQFTIKERSIYRIYVPHIDYLDVDVWLRRGTIASPGTVVDRRTGYSEEMLYGAIDAGSYTIQLMYYGTATGMPTADSCPTYPLQLVIAPVSFYANMTSVTAACSSDTVSGVGLVDKKFSSKVQWSTTSAVKYNRTIEFTLTTMARFQAAIRFDFASGGLPLQLTGSGASGVLTIPVTVMSSSGHNVLFMDEFLPKGTYYLNIRDAVTTTPPSDLKCAQYELYYYVDTTATPTEDQCIKLMKLPTDLSTTTGGSKSYGGPQKTDGTIRLFGDAFYLSKKRAEAANWIHFAAPVNSLARVFTLTPSPNDIDFYLYASRNSTSSSAIYSSIAVGVHESSIWNIPAKSTGYDLLLYFFRVASTTCNYFHFEFEMAPRTTVARELTCPAVLPAETDRVPPSSATIAASSTFTFSSDQYLLTQAFVEANTNSRGLFKYRITLTLQATGRLSSTVRFDFLSNDMRLKLRTQSLSLVAEGVSDGTANRNDRLNFQNSISAENLDAGVYYLDLEEQVEAALLKNLTNGAGYCQGFAMSLTVDTEDVTTTPEIVSVEPVRMTNIVPCDDLTLTVTFSDAVANLGTDPTVTLNNNKAAKLRDNANSSKTTVPAAASLSTDGKVLTMRFAGAFLELGHVYVLDLVPGSFKNSAGTAFTRPAAVSNTYSVASCNCSDRGTCSYPGPSGQCLYCDCVFPWSGDYCDTCASGYHPAGLSCSPDEQCTDRSCSGHGTCSDTTGYITCSCSTGYASTGSYYCNACAVGYTGYPNCTLIDEYSSTACTAKPLPKSLDIVPYLGHRGRVHLSGQWHAEISTSAPTDVKFSLTEDSVFRVYVEPHQVDIDLWLLEIDSTGATIRTVTSRTSFYSDESIYVVLPGGTTANPARYALRFRYWTWDKSIVTSCDTFAMELSISSVSDVKRAVNAWSGPQACTGVLPNPPFARSVISTDVSYAPKQNFSISPIPWTATTGTTADNRKFFWNTMFTIAERTGLVAIMSARAAYRYRTGQIVLLLERLDNASSIPDTCPRKTLVSPQSSTRCTSGENALNANYFEKALTAGSYVLHMYEAAPQNSSLSPCAPFEFELSFRWAQAEASLWTCPDSAELPLTLNAPGYLSSGDSVHIHDSFVVDGSAKVVFTLTKRSLFRVLAVDGTLFSLAYRGAVISSLSAHIYATLEGSTYNLTIMPPAADDSGCQLSRIELAIEPLDSVSDQCALYPSGETLPTLGVIRIPFTFGPTGSNQSFPTFVARDRTRSDRRIAQYTFTIAERGVLYAGVLSDFLYSSLGVELYSADALVAQGEPSYNSAYISLLLEPASYTLAIVVQEGSPVPVALSCSAFNFLMRVMPYAEGDEDTQCLLVGEAAPVTFDSQRFMQPEGTMNYAAEDLRMPLTSSMLTVESIPLTVTSKTPSALFRAFVEPNDNVDIDIKLVYRATRAVVASGLNGIYTEETILTIVEPGEYALEIWYWVWDRSGLPDCPTFRMQVALVSANPLVEKCRTGADRLPESYPTTGLPGNDGYEYFSARDTVNTELYFQQRTGVAREFKMPFKLTQISDFYADVTTDFTTGHLALRLRYIGTTTSSEQYWYGAPELNRHTLVASGLKAGSYELVLYEPVVPLDMVLGCVKFSFSTFIVLQGSEYSNEHALLPKTLDSLAYLQGGDAGKTVGAAWVHVADTFSVWRHNQRIVSSSMTLWADSSVHVAMRVSDSTVAASLAAGDFELALVDLSSGSAIATSLSAGESNGEAEFYVRAPAGRYNLTIRLLESSSFVPSPGVGTTVSLQLSIAGMEDILGDVVSIPGGSSCATAMPPSITPDPTTGYYTYSSNTRAISWNDLSSAPRTVRYSLKITSPATLFARLGNDFTYARLELALEAASGTELAGTMGQNTNEIYYYLPAGNHSLVMRLPAAPTSTLGPAYARCTPFFFSIEITRNSTAGGECSSLGSVPWDLNRADGGSAAYGGPMDDTGKLSMYAEKLAVPITRLRDYMAITVTKASSISVFLSTSTASARSPLRASLYNSLGTLQTPATTSSSTNGRQVVSIWAAQPAEYYITLFYPTTAATSAKCPSFNIQVLVEPIDSLRQDLECASGFVGDYPSRAVNQSLTSPLYTEFKEQPWSSGDIPGTVLRTDPYTVTVTTQRTSILIIDFGFDALVNAFGVRVQRTAPTTAVLSTGTWRSTLGAAFQSSLATRASVRVAVGTHIVSLRQQNVSSPVLGYDSGRGSTCYPAIYDLQLIPEGVAPYVSDVNPSSLRDVDPRMALTLTVTFSEGVRSIVNQTETVVQALCRAFALGGLAATSCAASPRYPNTIFELTWAANTLASDTEYRLSMTSGIIVARASSAAIAIYASTNAYVTLDTSCSGRGSFTDGACVCDAGYAGEDCSSCADGYEDRTESGKVTCSPITSCEATTCGCESVSSSGKCVSPLGTCSINKTSGRAQCVCRTGVTGAFCTSCAAGYWDYPTCGQCLNNGTWVHSSETCQCLSNFAGDKCDRCASGYSSYPSCTKSSSNSSAVTAAAVIVSLLVVGGAAVAAVLFVRHRRRQDPQAFASIAAIPAAITAAVAGAFGGSAADADVRGRYAMINAAEEDIEEEDAAPEVVVGGDKLPPSVAPVEAADAAPAADDFDPRAIPVPPTDGGAVLAQPVGDYAADSQVKGLLEDK